MLDFVFITTAHLQARTTFENEVIFAVNMAADFIDSIKINQGGTMNTLKQGRIQL